MPLPWDMAARKFLDQPFPYHASASLGYRIVWASGFALLIAGLLAVSKVFVGVGVGLLGLGLVARLQPSSKEPLCEIFDISYPESMHEFDHGVLTFKVRNDSKFANISLLARAAIAASHHPFKYIDIGTVKPGTEHQVSIPFVADGGMGHCKIGPISLIRRDTMGLKSRCFEWNWRGEIQVWPEQIVVDEFQIDKAGAASHSGAFERAEPGQAVTFYGLREFRFGDSIRKIDWKRSHKFDTLIVKEYEQLCSTDATILADISGAAHSHLGGISTMESLRDSLNTICRSLVSNQLRVQVLTQGHHIPFGVGEGQRQLVETFCADLEPKEGIDLRTLVTKSLSLIPAESVVVLIFSSAGSRLSQLREVFAYFADRRIEPYLIILDSPSYVSNIMDAAHIGEKDAKVGRLWQDFLTHSDVKFYQTLGKLVEHTYIVGPRESFADAYIAKSEISLEKDNR